MLRRLLGVTPFALAAAVGASGSCGDSLFACMEDSACGDGVCQSTGFCSFPDDECSSGQRYGEHAPAAYAGKCADGVDPPGTTSQGETTTVGSTSGGTPTTDPTLETTDDDSTGREPDLPSVEPECTIVDFDVIPLPGWSAYAKGATANVTDGVLAIEMPEMGAGSAGLMRASSDVVARRFELDIQSIAENSEAQIGISLATDGAVYRFYDRLGTVIAARDDGDGENVVGAGSHDGLGPITLIVSTTDGLRFELVTASGDVSVIAEETVVLESATASIYASTSDTSVTAGTVFVVTRVVDCPDAVPTPR